MKKTFDTDSQFCYYRPVIESDNKTKADRPVDALITPLDEEQRFAKY